MRSTLLAGAFFVVMGCGSGDDDGILDQHQALWEMKQPTEYVMETCGTGFSGGCTLTAVSQGQVVAARVKFGGDWSDVDPGAQEEPVKGLFRRAHSTRDCKRTRLSFDGQYGFVADVYFDCSEEGSGEQARCFVADSTDLSACDGR